MSDEQHNEQHKLFNGASLTHITGAKVSAHRQVQVQLPATSMAEVLETIHRLGQTGNLTVDFAHGRAMGLRWNSVSPVKPPNEV